MEKYIFKKAKGKYIWQGSELKLVFSGMTFQAHDAYHHVKISDITENFLFPAKTFFISFRISQKKFWHWTSRELLTNSEPF